MIYCACKGRKAFVDGKCAHCGMRRPKQKRVPRLFRGAAKDPVEIDATMATPATVHHFHDSRYWSPIVSDEEERVAPVTVYDANGKVKRVIQVEELRSRTTDYDDAYRTNFHLFNKRK